MRLRMLTPLQYACSLGLYKIVKTLLSAGADPKGNGYVTPDAKQQVISGQPPLIICLQNMFKQVELPTEGLNFKRKYDSKVDYKECLSILMDQFRVIPRMVSFNNTPTVFKAIKSNFETLQKYLEKDENPKKTVNEIDNKGLSPLCKLASQPETQDTLQKMLLLIKYGASCSRSLPHHHPIFLALKAQNYEFMRMMLKYSDAVHCFANFESPDPFLFTIVKANNSDIFKECITEWAELVRK